MPGGSLRWLSVLFFGLAAGPTLFAQEVPSLLLRLKAVGKEGAGHLEARKAWKELAGKGPEVLPEVLAGLDDASPAAANWIRSAAEAIAEKSLAQGKKINTQSLE